MPQKVATPFGAMLRQHRRAANLTQEGLAERAGLSARSISDLERGLSRVPHPDTVALLAQALSLSDLERAAFFAAAHARPAPEVLSFELPPLPRPLSPLIGREREEAALVHLLQRETVRLSTLTGPAGVGKTRLALQVAHSSLEAFPDGVVFVPLETIREPKLVISAIAQALGLQEKGRKDALQLLITGLQGRHVLLVLDNCEQVLSAARQIVELLTGCPALKILATSRARWRVRGEHVFSLAPLSLPDPGASLSPELLEQYGATALFLHCVRAIQPDFHLTAPQASVVAELCARLDGLPLAIELAAARFPLLPPQYLLDRLENTTGVSALHVLAAHQIDGPARHQSLRAALDWSYALLDERTQRLFRRLCVFAGSLAVDAVLAVCAEAGEEEHAVLDMLETLLVQNLIQRISPDEARFRLLETIRVYGLEQLSAGEEPGTRAAYASYMLTLARREAEQLMGAGHTNALTRLRKEIENLRAALRWFREKHELELGLQLAEILWRFWFHQGALSEGRAWLEQFLAEVKQAGEVQALTLARACYGAGVLAAEQGEYARALELGEQCSRQARESGERRLQAQALNLQGNVARYQGAFAQAAHYFEESLVLMSALQDHASVAVILNNLALLAQERGDYALARSHQEASLALKRRQGNQRGIAVALMNLGDIARDEGQLAEAQARAEESLRLFEQLGDEKGIALALNNLGEVALLQGEYERAATCIQDSLTRSRQMGDHWAMAVAFHNSGRLAWVRGERRQAYDAYIQSLQVYLQEQSQSGMIECLEGILLLFIADDPLWSTRLYALTANWRSRTGTPLPPVDASPLTQAVASLRQALGEEHFKDILTGEQDISLSERTLLAILSHEPPSL